MKTLSGVTLLLLSLLPGHAAEAELTVISYNIRHGLGMDGKVDLPRIAAVIRTSGAQVAVLQEVDRGMGRTQRRDLTAELAKALGWQGIFDEPPDRGQGTIRQRAAELVADQGLAEPGLPADPPR